MSPAIRFARPGLLALAAVSLAGSAHSQSEDRRVTSPDGRLAVLFRLTPQGEPRYEVHLEGRPVLQPSRLGLVRDDADFTRGLRLVSRSGVREVEDRYELLTSKRRRATYRANRQVFHLADAAGRKLDVIFQVSDDGVAFRYVFPERDDRVYSLREEVSSFHFLPGTRAWLQPIAAAKSGWERTNPSYEEYYEKEIPAGTPSPTGAGWVYPALFRSGETWLLVSETGLGRTYCGTRLRSDSPGGEYTVGFADPRETYLNRPGHPHSALPWATPWRLLVVGSLKTIAESTLGVDLAEKPGRAVRRALPEGVVRPGKSSWSWPLLGDTHTTYEVQKRFIEYAAEMGWRYCLIDALWDKQIGYDRTRDLVDYARERGVDVLLWYNSGGDHTGAPQTPRELLLTHESRMHEFRRLKEMGVAGLKVDFFGGDGQSMIQYYHDLLEDSAPFGFLMNFHGATLPRGWQRAYPHLMTMEAVRGLEYLTFNQENADREPPHATMLPFTRNVFDPMDYTPTVLDRLPRTQRRSTSGFQLAQAVLYTSGIQHYAEIPEGMAKAPDYVRDFLKHIPSTWDDVRFLDGYPGQFVVLARRSGDRWYLAGINGEKTERRVTLDLSGLPRTGTLIHDGEGGNLSLRQEPLKLGRERKLVVTLKPHGGFVGVLGR